MHVPISRVAGLSCGPAVRVTDAAEGHGRFGPAGVPTTVRRRGHRGPAAADVMAAGPRGGLQTAGCPKENTSAHAIRRRATTGRGLNANMWCGRRRGHTIPSGTNGTPRNRDAARSRRRPRRRGPFVGRGDRRLSFPTPRVGQTGMRGSSPPRGRRAGTLFAHGAAARSAGPGRRHALLDQRPESSAATRSVSPTDPPSWLGLRRQRR